MKTTALLTALLALTFTTTAFAQKRCDDQVLKVANAAYGTNVPTDIDVMTRLVKETNAEQLYAAEYISQYSDGASTQEFLEASFSVRVETKTCKILSVIRD